MCIAVYECILVCNVKYVSECVCVLLVINAKSSYYKRERLDACGFSDQ